MLFAGGRMLPLIADFKTEESSNFQQRKARGTDYRCAEPIGRLDLKR
jgi:hypothetical protein